MNKFLRQIICIAIALTALMVLNIFTVSAQTTAPITIVPLGTYETDIIERSAAEIVAYDADSHRLFVTNAAEDTVDILDVSDPSTPVFIMAIDLSPYGKAANSVTVHDSIVAAAIENEEKQANGTVAFFDNQGTFINSVEVGPMPDMLTFSPDGLRVVVANEGEPNADYSIDPEGSVTIIDLSSGVDQLTQADVTHADFAAFNDATLDASIRIFGPNATVAQDLEPEYIAISDDSKTAWVTLQENNALAVIDLAAGEVTTLVGLGFKDYSRPLMPKPSFPLEDIPLLGTTEIGRAIVRAFLGIVTAEPNGLDASDKDERINIQHWPVYGMYQPDAIHAYTATDGRTYLVTANEGDSRDYDGYSEVVRVDDLTLARSAFPHAAELQAKQNLGRMKTTTATGDMDGDGRHEAIYGYGARSFSIWHESGEQVFDSGSQFAQTIAKIAPETFNANSDDDSFDKRSDDKGTEPEAIEIATLGEHTYAFIGLERVSGIMIYDITDPYAPFFIDYVSNREFSGIITEGTAGDVSPEGIIFIQGEDSPVGKPLLVVANEVSGTVTLYEIVVRG